MYRGLILNFSFKNEKINKTIDLLNNFILKLYSILFVDFGRIYFEIKLVCGERRTRTQYCNRHVLVLTTFNIV